MFFNLIKEINRFLSYFFNSIKEIDRLRKKRNRLLSKGMSNIYLKFTNEEKNGRSQNFDLLGLKNLSPSPILGAPTKALSLNFKTSCCNLKIRRLGAKLCVAFLLF